MAVADVARPAGTEVAACGTDATTTRLGTASSTAVTVGTLATSHRGSSGRMVPGAPARPNC